MDPDQDLHDLMKQMTVREKLSQMSGDIPFLPGIIELALHYNKRPYPAGRNKRLGIAPLLFADGPRGLVVNHGSCFPVSIARGAAWDPALEERIGEAMAREARAAGANFMASVCINLLRHPAWGRAQETYGEDSYHVGEMGAALLRGLKRHVMACVKHFTANSIENTRRKINVKIGERALREVYLPHFKRCVEEGPAAVMSAYNRLNGEYCGENVRLLRKLLKEEWGFEGFVISDFVFGVYDTQKGVEGGLDIEMPFARCYGRRLKRLLKRGGADPRHIDDSVRRILKQKLLFSRTVGKKEYDESVICCKEHQDLAREAAVKSMVLLKNKHSLLPLDKKQIRKIALLGSRADSANLGDRGSSEVHPPYAVSPLCGLRAAAEPDTAIDCYTGGRLSKVRSLAGEADAVIIVAGYSFRDEGEKMPGRGGDRSRLTLSDRDERVIRAAATENERCVVVLVCGSAVVMEQWKELVPAVLVSWYPGMEGGNALADIIFGDAAPSGKLPFTIPKDAADLVPFPHNPLEIQYKLLHGYRSAAADGPVPAFHFGFGLGYTTFEYRDFSITGPEFKGNGPAGTVTAGITVKNTGGREGSEVVQVYAGMEDPPVERPQRELKRFCRVFLQKGEETRLKFVLSISDFAYFDEEVSQWLVPPGRYRIEAGGSSREKDLCSGLFLLDKAVICNK